MERFLSEFEQLLLLSILRIDDSPYGATIRRNISETTGRSVSVASIYVALARLEKAGLVSSEMGGATPVRGGRSRRCYQVESAGLQALARAREFTDAMWMGVDLGSSTGSGGP